MAEAKKNYANIEKIGTLLGADGIGALLKNVQSTEKKVGDILKKLSDLEAKARQRAQEEAARAEAETPAVVSKEEKTPVAEIPVQEVAPEKPEPIVSAPIVEQEKVEPVKEVKETAKKESAAAVVTEPVVKQPEEKKNEPIEPEPVKEVKAPSSFVEETRKTAHGEEKIIRTQYADRRAARAEAARNTFVNKAEGERAVPPRRNEERPQSAQQGSARPAFNTRPQGQGQATSQGTRFGTKPPVPGRNTAMGSRPSAGARPAMNNRPGLGGKFNAAPVVPPVAPSKNFSAPAKKKTYEKSYVEQKRTVNKRALVKQQVSVSDFDEDKSGYRKLRVKKQKQQTVQTIKIEHAVVTSENIPLKVLSEKLGITAVEITKRLFKEGIAKTINDSIDYDTAAYIANDLGIELEYKPEKTAEEALDEIYREEVGNAEGAVTRPPVVTVMGHVDHGKTSLLDKIRSTNVTAGEAGGITQHIGAYSVTVKGKTITFLDTPGHEAFTAMRARGASVTDIVILVVAADDGIMPQTVEAINHAKAADVPIIVAVNKMDKPEANLDRVKQGLTNNGLVPEEWGGDAIVVPVSAKTGAGIDELLDTINLVAEVRELKSNPDQMARGTIIEAKLDKGKGPVASVLIQNGTLHTGDNVISGMTTGRVRAMIDDKGRTVKAAGPSMAVSILGLEEVPNAGDSIIAVEQDKLLKQVLDERKRKESESMIKSQTRVTLDDVFGKIAEGKIKGLNIIVKGDVQGSVEAVKQSLLKLSNDEVRVNILHSGAGAITESDVMLADSSNAIIVGFNVRPDTKAKALAEKSHVDVRSYRIIYELLDDVQAALKGMLAPKYREIMTGKCDVLQTFKITGIGMVAGCYVTEGKIVRSGKLRIYRDDVMIVEGAVRQLKRFKDDVKEVSGGFECGVSIDGFDGIKIGDVIECYITEEIPA